MSSVDNTRIYNYMRQILVIYNKPRTFHSLCLRSLKFSIANQYQYPMIHPSVLWITSSVSHKPNANMYCSVSVVNDKQSPIRKVCKKVRLLEYGSKNPNGI